MKVVYYTNTVEGRTVDIGGVSLPLPVGKHSFDDLVALWDGKLPDGVTASHAASKAVEQYANISDSGGGPVPGVKVVVEKVEDKPEEPSRVEHEKVGKKK